MKMAVQANTIYIVGVVPIIIIIDSIIKICLAIIKMVEGITIGYKGTTVDNGAPRFFKRYHHSIFWVCFIREIIRVCNDCSEGRKLTGILLVRCVFGNKGTTIDLHIDIIGDYSAYVTTWGAQSRVVTDVSKFANKFICTVVEGDLCRIRVRIFRVITFATLTDCVNIKCGNIQIRITV